MWLRLQKRERGMPPEAGVNEMVVYGAMLGALRLQYALIATRLYAC